MGNFSASLARRFGGNPKTGQSLNKHLGVSTARVATKVILGREFQFPNIKDEPLIIYTSGALNRTSSSRTATDNAYKAKELIAKEGYYLIVDDWRMPGDIDRYTDDEVCVIARNEAMAKEAIEKLGCPKFLYLDYQLHNYDENVNIMPFLAWFRDLVLNPEYDSSKLKSYQVISQHETGRRDVDRYMFETMNQLWNREDKSST